MHKLNESQIRARLDRCDPQFREALEKSLRNLGNQVNRATLDPRTVTAITLRENAEVRREVAQRDDRRTVGAGEVYPEGFKIEVLADPPVMRDHPDGLRSRGMRPAKSTIATSAGKRNVETVTPAGKRAYDKATALRTYLPSMLDEARNCPADQIGENILRLTDTKRELQACFVRGIVEADEVQTIHQAISNLRDRQCAIAGKPRLVNAKNRKNRSMAPGYHGAGRDHPTIRDRVINTQLAAQPAKVKRPKKSSRKRTIV